ncbi:sensor histidine kinase [Sporanaerobium hydrogeniformans]|uniref:sensor histidine kinase n=1 Tax=Sporanaerobium hydrogeniformans TaxID=3072179 RepID=UPI0015D4E7A1|nr:HAMP domain-containing sensor histidine kinase [Sporanaerobium hydrogeniformans]
MCVVLSILFLLLYKATNENWLLKGLTAIIFDLGIFLCFSSLILIMKIKLKVYILWGILSLLILDFWGFDFYLPVSVFMHKILFMLLCVFVTFKFFYFKKRSLLASLLLINNIIFAVIQWVFAWLFYFKEPVHFFWDNIVYIIQNFIISMILVCIAIQESRAYYTQKVGELQDEIVLGQKQLKESYEKNQLKSTFFTDLSHELKTPINVIYSNIQLFEKCILQDSNGVMEADKYLKSMQKNCYRLIKLVNNIIDVNKIESGYMTVEAKNYNIIPFVEDMVMSINAFAMQKQINILFDTEIEELIIACDMDKIEKIIFNLLSNAIKYTPNGGEILVYISYDMDYLYITVQDTGEGIPEALHEVIFNRFTQNWGELHQKYNSSGIGLELVKSLVGLHKGNIWIDKSYKEGCKITFSLPITSIDNMEPILTKNTAYSEYNLEFM